MDFVHAVRALVRGIIFLGIIVLAWIDYALRTAWLDLAHKRRGQAEWLHRWSRRIMRLLSVSLEVRGTPPASGMIVANHLGYLDTFVLSAVVPCVFVAKREIADWPVFGICGRCCGTVFVDRERRAGVGPAAEQMRAALGDGVVVVLFPEGTSSDGSGVLPFKPALFAPAVALACPVIATALAYTLRDGSAADEICWSDQSLPAHAFNLLGKRTIGAQLSFAAPRSAGADRKALARELHAAVGSMHASA